MGILEIFEKTDRTVASFNRLFPRSPLEFSPNMPVRIGRIVQGGFRELTVGEETVLHEVIMPRALPTEVKKAASVKTQMNTGLVIYSRYDELEDMELSPSAYKLWQVIKRQTSCWHTRKALSKATGINEKTVGTALQELKTMDKIELETSHIGIKAVVKQKD